MTDYADCHALSEANNEVHLIRLVVSRGAIFIARFYIVGVNGDVGVLFTERKREAGCRVDRRGRAQLDLERVPVLDAGKIFSHLFSPLSGLDAL